MIVESSLHHLVRNVWVHIEIFDFSLKLKKRDVWLLASFFSQEKHSVKSLWFISIWSHCRLGKTVLSFLHWFFFCFSFEVRWKGLICRLNHVWCLALASTSHDDIGCNVWVAFIQCFSQSFKPLFVCQPALDNLSRISVEQQSLSLSLSAWGDTLFYFIRQQTEKFKRLRPTQHQLELWMELWSSDQGMCFGFRGAHEGACLILSGALPGMEWKIPTSCIKIKERER